MATKKKSHLSLPEIEKIALEVAEMANREIELASNEAHFLAESRRARDEGRVVSAAKAEKLRLLASGMNGGVELPGGDGVKESVFALLAAKPGHIFHTAEVIKALGLNRSTASVYLSELAQKDRRIARIGKGKYQVFQVLQPAIQTPAATRSATAKEYTAGAMPDRVLTLLDAEPETIFVAKEICERFGLDETNDINAIRNALSRLARDAKIAKVSHGKYRALAGRRAM